MMQMGLSLHSEYSTVQGTICFFLAKPPTHLAKKLLGKHDINASEYTNEGG